MVATCINSTNFEVNDEAGLEDIENVAQQTLGLHLWRVKIFLVLLKALSQVLETILDN